MSDENAPNQLAYGTCPQCDSALQLKHVGKSSFLACTAYPACEYTHSLQTAEVTTLKVMDDSLCPKCKSHLAVKKGRYGMFIGCTNFPDCDFISTNNDNQTTHNYTPVNCNVCKKGTLQKKQNRFGKFFYACDNFPKCKHVFNLEPVEKTCPLCQASIMLKQKKDKTVLTCAQSGCEHVIHETS